MTSDEAMFWFGVWAAYTAVITFAWAAANDRATSWRRRFDALNEKLVKRL
jgi:hypothetical protein